MRDQPALIHRIAVKPTTQLIAHAPAGHFLEREFNHVQRLAVTALAIIPEQRPQAHAGRKFRRLAKPPVGAVKIFAEMPKSRFQYPLIYLFLRF